LFWGASESDIEVRAEWRIQLVHFNIGKGCPTGWADNQFLYNPFKAIIALEDLEGRPLFVNPALCSMRRPSERKRVANTVSTFLLEGAPS